MPSGGEVAVTVEDVEVRKEDARFELRESLRESFGAVASGGRSFVARVLYAQEPNRVGIFVGDVEEVERTCTVFCGGQGELEGEGMVLMSWGRDRSVAEACKKDGRGCWRGVR